MNVQLQSKKLIKPSTPTPPNLSTHKLSFIDEQAPKMYVPIILYYSPPPNANTEKHNFYNQLEKTLAQTLVQYYPLAGRYDENLHIINCNDQGVEFLEANVDFSIQEILSKTAKIDANKLNSLIPREICMDEEIASPLVAIQVTTFSCGGLALGVCVSHRIADACTLSMFLESWSSISHHQMFNNFGKQISPIFNSATFFPGRNYVTGINLEALRRNIDNNVSTKIVTRRFLFKNEAISSLKASRSNTHISRVQLINAILWKAIARVEKLKDVRAGLIVQPVNLRDKTVHCVPKNCCGNLCLLAMVAVVEGEDMEILDLAEKLNSSITWSFEEWTKVVSRGENDPFLEELMGNLVNYYMISSWCRFPFYEVDFGWGKPSWVSSVNFPVRNWMFLLDDENGEGVEVWVNLDENDMVVFEQGCGVQAFGSST